MPLVFLLAMVALYVRAPELFFAPSLWAEDVDRFVEAFAKHGFASVFMALHGAGYHQLFERLAAAASLAILPLQHAESAFHVVSILVVGFAGVMTWVCLPTRSLAMRLAAVLAIVFVPIDGSTIYLTLVNTQWILAPVTMLLIVTEFIPRSRHKAAWCALLAVLCLTGPFAVMAMPVVLARMLLYRDLKREKLFYASIVIPVAIQCVALARNAATRLTTVEYSDSVRAWLRGILDNTLYQLIPNRGLLLLFGVLLAVLVWRLVRERDRERTFIGLALLFLALVNLIAGFYSYRNMPQMMGPLTIGERYFYVPFVLLFFFVLSNARGLLKPAALFFVAYACLANLMPFAMGPSGRGPNHWRSQVEASRFFAFTPILMRPIWIADAAWRFDIANAAPQKAPVEKALAIDRLELVGIAAEPLPGGGHRITRAPGVRNLIGDAWTARNVQIAPAAGGARDVTILAAPDNELYQDFGGVEKGGTLMFSFEARADAPMTVSPHVSDYKAGVSFLAPLDAAWKPFAFEFAIKPGVTPKAGVYLTWHTGTAGKFQVRNAAATLDAPNYVLIPVPQECAPYRDLALTYTAPNANGLHRLDASASKDAFREWDALHRYMATVPDRKVMFALPIADAKWLRLTLPPPLELRDLTIRCF